LEVPFLDGRVSDQAGIMSPGAIRQVSTLLAEHERKTGDQIAVLTLPSLEGESLEDFSVRVAQTWKLGQKGKDNGILLLVAPQEHKMRIEVGYGLEASLPDALAGRIIRDEIAPAFRHQDYDGGIRAGVEAILGALEGSYTPKVESRNASRSSGNGLAPDMDLPMRILLGAFIFGILGLFTAMGIFVPDASGWFLYFFLIPFWAMFPIVILGPRGALWTLGCHLVGFPILRLLLPRTAWGKNAASHIHSSGGCHGSSYSNGWSFSSGGGGFSSGGGGFSGGGGSFGGGGASGSW
jgi:uncharacterized protein